MAKITIEIEDVAGDKVSVTTTPKFSEIMQLAKAGKLTAAHGYAVLSLNKIREAARTDPKGKIIVPVPRLYGRDS